jgi:hypothetical protein
LILDDVQQRIAIGRVCRGCTCSGHDGHGG